MMSVAGEVHVSSHIDSRARIAPNVKIGPFCIIGPDVVIEENVTIESHVNVQGRTVLQRGVHVHNGCVLGGPPQDVKYQPETVSGLDVGENTILREFVTANLGTTEGSTTHIGKNTMIMAYSHIAHNDWIGDHVTIANAVQLAGYVTIEDNVVIGGMVPIHQFCRIGRHSIVGGGCRVGKDVPPFVRAAGEPLYPSSLNMVGLTRRGFSSESIKALKQAFRILYREGLRTEEALDRIAREVPACPEVKQFHDFVATSERGIVR